MKIKSLTTRISVVVTIMTLCVLMATLLTVYKIAIDNHKKEAHDETHYQLDLVVERLSKIQTSVEQTANFSVPALKACMDDTMKVMKILTDIVETNQYVNSAALAYAPNRLAGHPYCIPIAANYGTISRYFSDKERHGEYIYEDWYIAPALEGIAFWTDPYLNMLEVPVVSYAVPVKSEEHGFEGVLTLAVELTNLSHLLNINNEQLDDSTHQNKSHGIILDRNTTFLSTRNKEYIMNETLFTLAASQGDTIHSYVGRQVMERHDGEEVIYIKGEKSVMTWHILPKLLWTVMVITPYSEVYASVNQLSKTTIIVALLATLAAIVILYFSVRRALRPFKRLKEATHLLGEGKYDTELPHQLTKRQDEIGELGREFMRMEKAVKQNIDELKEERQRVQRSYEELDTLVHNTVAHLRVPINNVICFNDALSTLVADTDEACELKKASQESVVTILKNFNQLNEMAELVSLKPGMDHTMVDVSSEEFIDEAVKGAQQLEDRFFLKVNEVYRDRRRITIHTNTIVLENLLFQLIVEAAKVSKTDEIGLHFRVDKEKRAMQIVVEAKTDNPIPDEEKEKFFQRFAEQKVNAYVTSDYLQLFICYRIAKRLGVKLFVDTTSNVSGNQFVIEIPRV